MPKNNMFKYSNLDVNEIMSQIIDRISSDTRFDNFRESSVAETLLEIFAGVVDINNYYIQRRAEENFLDTAQLRSSIISIAKQLGYVPSRPSPAHAYLTVKLEGDFSNIFNNNTDNRIVIPYYAKFNYDGDDFILKQTLSYRIPNDMLNKMNNDEEDFEGEFSMDSFGNPIEIVQGKIKEKVILGENNTQIGSIFQKYKIEDREFSNLYGDKDIFYHDVTRVYVGDSKNDETRYTIDRRSLINWESFGLSLTEDEEPVQVCLIRTTPDETVELLFGDDRFAALGPRTRGDNIYIQYLSTLGSDANKIGVIGEGVDFSGKIFSPHGDDITDMVSFELKTNIIGGTDFETSDSIKYSAPKIYYSLDRLVAKRDYEAYLKSLTSPINVRNAIAWGEQEQTQRIGSFADMKSFNAAFFTLIGSLYNTSEEVEGVYSLKAPGPELDSAILDIDFDPDGINDQSYFNVYSRQRIAQQLKMYNVKETYNVFKGREIGPNPKSLTRLKQGVSATQKLIIEYGSDKDENVNNITHTISKEITLTDINSFGNLQSTLETILGEIKDERSVSTENKNFGKDAFVEAVVECKLREDDTKLEQIVITLDKNSPCYIKSIKKTANIDGDEIDEEETEFFNRIGLTDGTREIISKPRDDKVISNKIIQVVRELDLRSQMVVRNIYMSPTMHTFNLEGNIYINSMFDLEDEQIKIKNDIYEWLDQYSDFNVPVHISNIIDIIENNPGVHHANVRLVPNTIYNGVEANIIPLDSGEGNEFFKGLSDNIVQKYGGTPFVKIIDDILREYFELFDNDEKHNIFFTFQYTPQLTRYQLPKGINVRNFYDNFVNNLYETLLNDDELDRKSQIRIIGKDYELSTENINKIRTDLLGNNERDEMFISKDFTTLVERIYKDLLYVMRLNMMDSHGNIEKEYIDGRYIRGGYSLGSEIVRIDLSSTDSDNRPKLNFRYK